MVFKIDREWVWEVFGSILVHISWIWDRFLDEFGLRTLNICSKNSSKPIVFCDNFAPTPYAFHAPAFPFQWSLYRPGGVRAARLSKSKKPNKIIEQEHKQNIKTIKNNVRITI